MSRPAGLQTFRLQLGLGPTPDDVAAVRRELGPWVDAFDPQVSGRHDGVQLTLAVPAADVWLAVLTAMAAVTGSGYEVTRLEAGPG